MSVSDEPGGLESILEALNKLNINIEYLYAFVEKKRDNAIVVIRTENIEEGIKTLENGGITVLSSKEVYSI